MDALLVQAGLVGPLILALVLRTASQRHRGRLHRYLFWLMTMILVWMTGMVLQASGRPVLEIWAVPFLLPPICFMAPLFCLIMLVYARVGRFADAHLPRRLLMAPFGLFLIGFATQPWHGLMADPAETVRQMDVANAGPLFWAFQVWSNGVAVVGLGVCLRILWRGPTHTDRARAGMLLLAAAVPLAVHALFVYRVLPLDFPLTPASLGVTALLLVAAIERYGLLEVPPVARRDVIEASGDAVLITNLEEVVVDVNPAACRILGAPRETLCGRRIEEALALLGPTEPPLVFAPLREALRRSEATPHVEVETADARALEVSAGSPRDASGGRVGYFAVLRDRTHERRAERLLHQTQKLESVGILAAGVAHEVNNPLAFVRANLAQLHEVAALLDATRERLPKEVAAASEEMSEIVEESLAGLDRMGEIVKGLLRFSRAPTGRLEPCDLNALLKQAVRFASLDRGSRVELVLDLDEALPPVEASPEPLAQVLLNLLLNAIQALSDTPDARIVASTRTAGDAVEVRVTDNGPGVPEAIRSRIFDPFFTTRAPNAGTGLGLSIAFDIARNHGGRLELEHPPGGGACFLLRLPRSARAG